jgi:hypothetical protein
MADRHGKSYVVGLFERAFKISSLEASQCCCGMDSSGQTSPLTLVLLGRIPGAERKGEFTGDLN